MKIGESILPAVEDVPEQKPAENEPPVVEDARPSSGGKSPLAAGGFLIVVIVAVVLFAVLKKSPQTTKTPVVSQEATSSSPASATKGSIKSLLTAGKSVSCTVNYGNDQNVSSGKINVSGNKVYGEFTVKGADGRDVQSYMIQDGDYGYFWSGIAPTGTKFKIDPTASPQAQSDKSVDVNRDVDMNCSSWSVDNSKFVPPANVKFTDVSAVLKQTTQSTSNVTTNGTKANCDQITDPQAKAACLQYSGQ